MTPPPSFSQLFYIALTKSLNNGYQDYYLSEIVEALGEYKLVEIKKENHQNLVKNHMMQSMH